MLRPLLSPRMQLRLFSHKFSRQFSFLGKMNRARDMHPTSNSSNRRQPVGALGSSVCISSGAKGGNSNDRNEASHQRKVNDITGCSNFCSISDASYEKEYPSLSASIGSGSNSKRKSRIDLGTHTEQKSEEESGDIGSMQLETTPVANSTSQQDVYPIPASFGKKHMPSPDRRLKHDQKISAYAGTGSIENSESAEENGGIGSMQLDTKPVANSTSQQDVYPLPTSFGKKHVPSPNRRPKHYQNFPAYAGTGRIGNSESAEGLAANEPFDICVAKSRKSVVLQDSLHGKSRKKWVAIEHSKEVSGEVLRPGMVLLKTYITLSDQVKIVNKCRELGLGPGGFYQPYYRDGAKLHLQMMCLGLNWDPETRLYEDRRPIDGSEPPGIPRDFSLLVERAIQDSFALIKKDISVSNVEDILPGMSPNICIVNFYKTSGRLGLHQDRDESKESLRKRLPVVSFSFGDSAEFLYGDQRDVEKAKKVILESGDVLIFGGESRHVFHGVSSIIPNSAPPPLFSETKLRPGRLNLTFRQY